MFSLNNSPLSAVSIFENILRAFDSAYYEKLKSLSPEFSHDASMRFLLEPVVQSLILIFEELHRSLTKPTIHWEEYDQPHSKPLPPGKMQEIEKQLDEIEASLNAVSPGDKVTPIWEISAKKK